MRIYPVKINMNVESERAKFEKWVSPRFNCTLDRCPNDTAKTAWPDQYVSTYVQLAWEAWQEALKL